MAYIKKYLYEFEIQGFYGSEYGWEHETTEETYKDARVQVKCYRENQPEYSHRIKKVRAGINPEYSGAQNNER